ncbi:MAG: hypothetical protein RRY79_00260 [Clostridia bacterium]
MIKITGVQQEEARITDAYLTDDHSAIMISNTFSDDEADEKYQCFEFSEYGIVMVSN